MYAGRVRPSGARRSRPLRWWLEVDLRCDRAEPRRLSLQRNPDSLLIFEGQNAAAQLEGAYFETADAGYARQLALG